jgi:glycosyltransferase involved in cell wall biosynthesis
VILFDLSRLVSRAGRETPTGIDRVEFAYAEHLIGRGLPLSFTMLTAAGRFGLLPRAIAEDYVAAIGQIWRGASEARRGLRRTKQLVRMLKLCAVLQGENALVKPIRTGVDRPTYLLVSHHHLEKRRAIDRLKRQARASFVCLIHDLIPIEFPEYALPGQDDKHRRRIESAAATADAVIVNSAVTRDAFLPYLERAGRNPPVLVAPFGVDFPTAGKLDLPDLAQPYFVCIGTIEARKNHLLLLNVWRQLAAELGDATPALVLIGQRGWETESAIDMLERSPALRGFVLERSNLSDAEMIRLLKGAQALLLPSFAEGFGFPLIEALAQGVPVLCSNLAALRENGGDVPEYLDPLDGLGWRAAVIDYSEPASPRRAAQLRRMSGWRAPSWEHHFAEVETLIAETRAAGQTSGEPRLDPHPTAEVSEFLSEKKLARPKRHAS